MPAACDLVDNGVLAIFGPSAKTDSGECVSVHVYVYYYYIFVRVPSPPTICLFLVYLFTFFKLIFCICEHKSNFSFSRLLSFTLHSYSH